MRMLGELATANPGKIFAYLLAASGAVALLVYLAIAVSQFVLSRTMRSAGERAPVRMWLFPYLTIGVIVAIVAVLVLMAFDPDQQQAIFLSLISAALIVGAGVIVRRRRSHHAQKIPLSSSRGSGDSNAAANTTDQRRGAANTAPTVRSS